MRLEHLEYLIAVAKTGSINQASEKLHTSQQNLSRVLQQLEAELGATLFKRTYHGIELTLRGKQALAVAQDVVPKLYDLKAQCAEESQVNVVSGEVQLLCAPASIFALIPSILANFSTIYPGIKLSIEEMEAGLLSETLANDPTLVGISSEFFNHKAPAKATKYRSQLQFKSIFSDRLAVFLSKKSPLAKQKSISATSIIKHPLAMYVVGEEADSHTLTVLREYGDFELAFKTRNMNLYMQAVTQGDCIGFTSNYVFQKHQFYNKDALTTLPIRDNMEFSTNVVTNKSAVSNPARECVIEFLLNHMS